MGELGRPVAIAVAAAIGLLASYLVAAQRPVPAWELRLTAWLSDASDLVAGLLHPVMQLGTFAGILLVAGAILGFRRDVVLGAAVVVTGLVTWLAAKLVKRIVGRDRPVAYLPEVVVRDGDGAGLGYASGHSAVAACAALMAMVALPRRWRPLAAVLAFAVGVARIVHGVHLPADVVGGWSLGVLTALAGLAASDAVQRRSAR